MSGRVGSLQKAATTVANLCLLDGVLISVLLSSSIELLLGVLAKDIDAPGLGDVVSEVLVEGVELLDGGVGDGDLCEVLLAPCIRR